MTVTKVWEHAQKPGPYSFCCSSTVRLDNGNTVVMFGSQAGVRLCCNVHRLVESDPDGLTVAKIIIRAPGKGFQYRAYPIDSLFGEAER